MGYYLQIDQLDAEPIASNSGYGEVISWAQGLPEAGAAAIRHLFWFGWEDDIRGLIEQFGAALENAPPVDPVVLGTVTRISKLIAAQPGAIVVTITDGLGTSAEDEDDDPHGDDC